MATNPGTTNLVSWWTLNEASGNRADSHGSETLTDTNTVGSTTGLVGNAALFVSTSSEMLTHADDAPLSTGDIDFSFAGWLLPHTVAVGVAAIVSKISASTSDYEYQLYRSANTLNWRVSPNGSTFSPLITSSVTLSTGNWFFFTAWHDATGNILGLRVTATDTSTAYTGGVYNSTANFAMGANPSATGYLSGLLDEVCFFKEALSTGEMDWLYNSGAGRTYNDLLEGHAKVVIF